MEIEENEKNAKSIVIVLIIAIFCCLLTGCGEQNTIKKACEEYAKDSLDKTGASVLGKGLVAVGELYNKSTWVNYDKSSKSFECKVYAVVSYTELFSNGTPSLMYEQFTFKGHMDGSNAIIDKSDVKQIDKSIIP